jgi:Conjugal transfer protein TraD
MTHRVEASQRRTDKRDWVMHRRERTRHLIELGGLVQKAGLVELTGDDRAVLLGAFLSITDKLQSEYCHDAITLWRRRGNRAFGSKFDSR